MSDHDAIARVRSKFADGLPARVQAIRAALDDFLTRRDRESARTFYLNAHKLTGAAASFGAAEVADCAACLDELGCAWSQAELESLKQEQFSAARESLDQLELAVERYRTRQIDGGVS
jgi:HPt (histidine-containing phosphotransfer) domain-containing protein